MDTKVRARLEQRSRPSCSIRTELAAGMPEHDEQSGNAAHSLDCLQLADGDILAKHDAPRRILAMHLESVLRGVQAGRANLCQGRLTQVVSSMLPLRYIDAVRGASSRQIVRPRNLV